jgi:hypothetical protein
MTGRAAKNVPKTGRAAKGMPNTGRAAKNVPKTGRAAKGVNHWRRGADRSAARKGFKTTEEKDADHKKSVGAAVGSAEYQAASAWFVCQTCYGVMCPGCQS